MKPIGIIFLVIVIILFATGCKESESDEIVTNDLVIGLSHADLILNTFDFPKIIQADSTVSYAIYDSIDIDKDGICDVLFSSVEYLTLTASYISCINNKFNIGYSINYDSVFHKYDTINENINLNEYTRDVYNRNINELFSQIEQTEIPYLLEKFDTLRFNGMDFWDNTHPLIFSSSNNIKGHLENYKHEIIGDYFKTVNILPWNSIGIKYIPIIMRDDNKAYLGWLKIEIEEVNKIILYETALQTNL
jgi:hypothetical protein